MTRQKTVTIKPRYISQGNRFGHVVHPGYKRTSTLGGAFDDTRIIARIGLVPAVVIILGIGVPVVLAIVGCGL
jgi:hypothetical protein